MSKPNENIRKDIMHRREQGNRKELKDTMETNAVQFCANLRFLMNNLCSKNPKDDDLIDLKRRLNLATTSNPRTIIEIAGPYFFKYRKSIASGNMDKFVDGDYMDDVREAAQKNDIKGDVESVSDIIVKIKSTWKLFKPAEKQVTTTKIVEMLSFYAQYLMSQKKLKALKTKTRQSAN